MRLLLDENLPKKLRYRFNNTHEVLTVPEMGWSGIKNGDLLKQMQDKGLEILLSIDKNMSHQQHLEKYNISLVVFKVKDARYDSLLPFVAKVEQLLEKGVSKGLTVLQ